MDARNVSVFRAAAEVAVKNPDHAEIFLKAAAMTEDDGIGYESSRTILKRTKGPTGEVRP